MRGAPSKLLDELIATPSVKKRRGGAFGPDGASKKNKGSLERLHAWQAQQQHNKHVQQMMSLQQQGLVRDTGKQRKEKETQISRCNCTLCVCVTPSLNPLLL